jgi:hypothetical protein
MLISPTTAPGVASKRRAEYPSFDARSLLFSTRDPAYRIKEKDHGKGLVSGLSDMRSMPISTEGTRIFDPEAIARQIMRGLILANS